WKRHVIKTGGAKQHHDQVFGDFKGTGKPQLAFWNQGAKKIFLADIPANPREAGAWPMTAIFTGETEGRLPYAEGMSAHDIDGDGYLDIFCAEMAKWYEKKTELDHLQAIAWIFFGDGKGNFRKTEFATGVGFHEARVVDLNGDGKLDIFDKFYN